MRNKEDISKHVISMIQNSTLVTRGLCAFIILLYLIGFIPSVDTQLVMTPGFLIPPQVKVWTLVTSPFYETSFIVLLMDLAVLTVVGHVLEPLWNIRSYLIFIAVVNVGGLTLAALICYAVYFIARLESFLFLPFNGMYGFTCACAVAFKQAHPDRPVLPVLPFLRYKDLPILLLLVFVTLTVLGILSSSYVIMSSTYIVVSWVFLRFYQTKSDGSRGDMADSFSFASFFPEAVQPLVSVASGSVFHLLVMTSICPEAVRTYDVGASSSAITITLPGTLPADAQRRKQRAIKALNERLNKLDQPQSSQWPSMEDEDSTPSQPLPQGSPDTIELQDVAVETEPSKETTNEPALTTTDHTS
ncbi:transmembrane protein 115-like [Dysidea avara]|uniref:transmembrane protein 115-like n=1 Tax=Dysidea avara TaxID=196820 RepID=UPI00331C9F4F